jgi:hypothetical protein
VAARRLERHRAIVGLASIAWFAACPATSSGTAASGTASTSSSTSTTSGSPAPSHPLFPQVPDNGGPVLASPQVIALHYGDDQNWAFEQAALTWLLGSSWLAEVGDDYGVGTGSLQTEITLAPTSPQKLSDDDVHAAIDALFADGGVAVPGAGSDVVFVLFVPGSVDYDLFGTTGCMSGSVDSYHLWYFHGDTQVPYAVVLDCPGQFGHSRLEQLQLDLSHEVIEVATDPFGFGNNASGIPSDAWRITDAGEPFYAMGDEVADLCIWISAVYVADAGFGDAGFVAQRVYSNKAAEAGLASPCIPAPIEEIFYTLATDAGVAFVSPGNAVQVTLTGWTTDAGSDAGPTWCVQAVTPAAADFVPTFAVPDGGATVFRAGTQLTITVGTPTGQAPPNPDDAGGVATLYGPVLLESEDCDAGTVMSVWPVQVALPPVRDACAPAAVDPCERYGLLCLDGGCALPVAGTACVPSVGCAKGLGCVVDGGRTPTCQ